LGEDAQQLKEFIVKNTTADVRIDEEE